MTTQEFHLLYEKLLSGTITAEEKLKLSAYIDKMEEDSHPWQDEMGNKEAIEEEIHSLLAQQVQPKRTISISRVLAVAAAITGLIIIAGGIYKYNQPPIPHPLARQTVPAPVKPGKDRAILTLADGSVITLDSAKNGSLINKNGITIKQIQNGAIAYNAGNADPATWSTISTPRGGQYQIVLEDGTKAWLNAASSLRFPTSFRNNERTVEVSGEVYFEIATDASKPFKVNFNGNTISVLGTHFNVNAYKDEDNSKVTLLEGAIKVSNKAGQQLLKPGMQAQVSDSNSHITTCKANMEAAIAWKNGYFTFDQENIQSIMRKLARWYDISVNYRGDMTGKIFSGTISRFDDISEVLGMISLTGTIHFQIQGRDLIVMP